jgi:glycosyltransferase involved in cell wall biosynthesis
VSFVSSFDIQLFFMAARSNDQILTIVVPFYNEMGSIVELVRRIEESVQPFVGIMLASFEILIVENGSLEEQKVQLSDFCRKTSFCRILSLSRNFGYQGALWAGLDHAQSDPVVFIDGDGEDPPELISEFIKQWKAGYDVVYGVRLSRKANLFYRFCYWLFYRLLARFASFKIPLDAGEFSLVSGQALSALRNFGDRTRMLRILRAWVGYRQIGVNYHRQSRIAGETKFGLFRAVAFAWDGFVSSTDVPVRLSIYCATFCFTLGVVGACYYVFWYFFGHEKIPGFASLNITILILFSALFACFSVLARYVLTLLEETRKRPPYLVDSNSRREDRE